MIRHCAFFRFKPEVSRSVIQELLNEFVLLAPNLKGLVDVQIGQNVSPEGLDRGFSHGLIMDFTSSKALDAYLIHPEYLVLADRLVAVLLGGIGNGVVAFDMPINFAL